MLHDLRMALVITRREVRDQFRDWRIIIPVIFLTVFFPGLMNFTARQAVSIVERYGAPVIGDRLIPFLLMIVGFFPISVSLVIALESFVGEKERRSIEPLLSSPLTDRQVYIGKLLAATAPALSASYLGIIVYLISVYYQIGWAPELPFLIQIVILTTVQAIVMVCGAIVVSSQTTSVRAANLLSSFIVVPVAMIIQGESMIMFWAIYSALWWIIVGMIVIAALLVRTGLAYFNREEMLGRELDVLNLRWGWQIYKRAFTGQARSFGQWYRQEVLQALRSLGMPCFFMLLALALGIWAGASQANTFAIPSTVLRPEKLGQGFVENLEFMRFFSAENVGKIWFQNLRAVGIATLLGIFSFGVLGMLVMMISPIFIGYITANIAAAGFSPFTFLVALVLPHGILEFPAILISGAAILNLGATLASPSQEGKTLGEAWLIALARWTKIMLGVVIPLFLAAALVEVFVTPHIAQLILNR